MDKSMHRLLMLDRQKCAQQILCTDFYSWTDKRVLKNFGTQIFITERTERQASRQMIYSWMDKSVHKDFGIQIFITEKLGQKDVHCTSRQLIYS